MFYKIIGETACSLLLQTLRTILRNLESAFTQVERAFEIFYEMHSEGRVQPNEVTFNALISAACKGGLPSYAFDAFEVMKTTSVAASRRTYNELIHAAGLRGIAGVEAAFEVYDSMRLAGEDPDQVRGSRGGLEGV